MSVDSQAAMAVAEKYRAAAEILRKSSLRRGNLVTLDEEDADEILITADLHGNRTNLRRILEVADLENQPRRHVVFQEVCHGGTEYPGGGGCMSHLMLEDIAELIVAFPRQVHFLMSNHELAELTDYPIMKGGRMLNLLFRTGMSNMYGDALAEVRAAQVEFLASLPLALKIRDELMIMHSLPKQCDTRPFDAGIFDRELTIGDRLCSGDAHRLVWGRDFRQENADALAKQLGVERFITGHEPCQFGHATPNSRQIVLDTCTLRGKFLLVPVGGPLDQESLLACIGRLHESAVAAT